MVRRREEPRGYVLAVALFVIALLMAGGALLAGSLHYRTGLLRQEAGGVHLAALTDAGLALALDRLSLAPFDVIATEETLGDGRVAVRSGLGTRVMVREVTVVATWGVAGRAVKAVVQLDDHQPPRVVSWRTVPFLPEMRAGWVEASP